MNAQFLQCPRNSAVAGFRVVLAGGAMLSKRPNIDSAEALKTAVPAATVPALANVVAKLRGAWGVSTAAARPTREEFVKVAH